MSEKEVTKAPVVEKSVSEKPVVDAPKEMDTSVMEDITIPNPKGDCVFSFPKDSNIVFLENASYRLLTHFVYNRINIEIAQQREVLKKEAEELANTSVDEKQKEEAKKTE